MFGETKSRTWFAVLACLTAITLAPAPLSANAGDAYLDITNATGFVLAAVYVAPADTETWGGNKLQNRTLPNGGTFRIPLSQLPSKTVKVKARDNEGDTYTIWSVNAENDLIITLNHIDPD